MKPVVGLTTYGRIERPSPTEHYEEHYTVPVVYVNAVRRAGGIPLLLSPGEDDVDDWLDHVDAVVMAGGTDIDPERYDTERASSVLIADVERDETEIALALAVLRREVPTLFVCRGMQVLNVALGGTLHAHIPDLGIGDIHRDRDGTWALHEIEAVESSRVAEAMQSTAVTTYSGHHQAVDRIADGLTVTAIAPDGIVEALEVESAEWAVGVQWHPEMSAAKDPTQQGLFDAVVSQAT